MAARADLQRMQRLGFGAIAPVAGMMALSRLLSAIGQPHVPAQLLGSIFIWDRHGPAAVPWPARSFDWAMTQLVT